MMAIITNPAFPFQNHVKPDPLLLTFRDYAISKGTYIQSNALTDVGGTPSIVMAAPKRGWQINWRKYAETLDGNLLETVLRNGMAKGDFIEVSDNNAINHRALVEKINSEMM